MCSLQLKSLSHWYLQFGTLFVVRQTCRICMKEIMWSVLVSLQSVFSTRSHLIFDYSVATPYSSRSNKCTVIMEYGSNPYLRRMAEFLKVHAQMTYQSLSWRVYILWLQLIIIGIGLVYVCITFPQQASSRGDKSWEFILLDTLKTLMIDNSHL